MGKQFAIALTAAALSACSAGRSEDSGPAVQRNYQVAGFEQIQVSGPYQVQVRTGSNTSVSASGTEKMIDRTIVEVKDGRLLIHPREKKGMSFGWSRDKPVQLTVTVPRLRSAAIAGSGDIRIDRVEGDKFEGNIDGSGGLELGTVQVQSLALAIAGSGDARARQGRANSVNYAISGSGNIDAREVASETAQVAIAGSGSIAANATKTANVDIDGSGDVEVTGGAECKYDKSGSGDVRCS